MMNTIPCTAPRSGRASPSAIAFALLLVVGTSVFAGECPAAQRVVDGRPGWPLDAGRRTDTVRASTDLAKNRPPSRAASSACASW